MADPFDEEAFGQALAAVVRRARRARRLTQEQLAIKSAVSRNHISELELGRTRPSFMVVCRLLWSLGVSWTSFGMALEHELRAQPLEFTPEDRPREPFP